MLGPINHIAYATGKIDTVRPVFEALGLPIGEQRSFPAHTVSAAFVELQNAKLEPLEPLGDKSVIAKSVADNPPGVLHHICFEVPDIRAAIAHYTALGMEFTTAEPKIGAHDLPVMFLHPKTTGGLLIELEQRAAGEITRRAAGFAKTLEAVHIVSNQAAVLANVFAKLGLKPISADGAKPAGFDAHGVTIQVFSPHSYGNTLGIPSPLAEGPKGCMISDLVFGTDQANLQKLAAAGGDTVTLPAKDGVVSCVRPPRVRAELGFGAIYTTEAV